MMRNVGIYCTGQARHFKAAAKLDHSQISAKYLVNVTTNYFVQAATAVNAELVLKNLRNSSISAQFGQLNSILCRSVNSVQDSASLKSQNPGIPS